jgi:clan AA aspartic protease
VIHGGVTPRIEASLELPVRDDKGNVQRVETVIDTGFSAELTLPRVEIVALGLPHVSAKLLVLADGSVQPTSVFLATVVWDGMDRTVEVHQLDQPPLLGMRMLRGHRITMDIIVGGDVTIEPIP